MEDACQLVNMSCQNNLFQHGSLGSYDVFDEKHGRWAHIESYYQIFFFTWMIERIKVNVDNLHECESTNCFLKVVNWLSQYIVELPLPSNEIWYRKGEMMQWWPFSVMCVCVCVCFTGRVFDPDKHCGVPDPETKRSCTRSLTCKVTQPTRTNPRLGFPRFSRFSHLFLLKKKS